MHGDVQCKPLIFHPCQAGQQDQMARGGDRQKLGHALNDGQKEQVEKGHRQRALRDLRKV